MRKIVVLLLASGSIAAYSAGCAGDTGTAESPPDQGHNPDEATEGPIAEAQQPLVTCATIQQGTSGVVQDSALVSSPATSAIKNYGVSNLLTGVLNGATQQSLIQFDLSAIPAGATITSADLTLHVVQTAGATVNLHRVTAPWKEGMVNWSNFMGAYAAAPATSFLVSAPGWVSATLVPLVQSWVSGANPNNGFLLESSAGAQTVFTPSDATIDPVPARHPKLVVCYTTPSCNGVVCAASDPCHAAGTCDPVTGQCSNPALPNGTACADGNACTQSDTCQLGVCTGSNPVVCTASDSCHAAGTCDPVTGQCSNPVGNGLGSITCGVGACLKTVAACTNGVPGVCVPGNPTAETCDGKDNDCDGVVDNGNPGGGASCNTGKQGVCSAGVTVCSSGQLSCSQSAQPSAETCDGKDNDCDGAIDNGNPGGGAACNTGKQGLCSAGTTACTGGSVVCNQAVQPSAETCDGKDNDCDGVIDNGNPGGGAFCNTGKQGVCSAGTTVCAGGGVVCNQAVQPSAETCDGKDNDCDGVIDNGNPGGGAFCSTGLYGVCAAGTRACAGGSVVCNQTTPASPEVCGDSKDNDCDGAVDNTCPLACGNVPDGGTQSCYSGPAGTQSVGVCKAGTQTCMNGVLSPCVGQVVPSPETCDGKDNDCNGQVDNGLGTISCGVGQCGNTVNACVNGVSGLCTPKAPKAEICDGIDNDCDGVIDNGNPGAGAGCSTGKPGICAAGTTVCSAGALACAQMKSPVAESCNGLDDDCDGVIDNGNPGGNQACSTGKPGVCSAGTTACFGGGLFCYQTTQPSTEVCDGLDNDCNGVVDNGNPGGGAGCNTGKPGVCSAGTTACLAGALACNQSVAPSVETCDGKDNNCNGQVDEGNPGGGAGCSTGKPGVCAPGTTACTAGALVCNQSVAPSVETCDGKDNNCNGQVDEGNPGGGAGCSTGKLGICAAGTTLCSNGGIACTQNQAATAEICNGLDDNCNGQADENINQTCYTGPAGTQNVGVCKGGIQTCANGGWGACQGEVTPSAEMCNGVDDDCNGQIDDGTVCCDPKLGTHGTVGIFQSACGAIQFASLWCTVGSPNLPAQCVQGDYTYSQSMWGYTCQPNGSCPDPTAPCFVSCIAFVDCVYDCNGNCVREGC